MLYFSLYKSYLFQSKSTDFFSFGKHISNVFICKILLLSTYKKYKIIDSIVNGFWHLKKRWVVLWMKMLLVFLFFMSAWWRNILGHIATVKITSIFISSSAVHIYDFHIFTVIDSEVMGSNPVQAWIFLFRPYFHYCVSSVHHAEIAFIFKETSQPSGHII